MPNSLRSDAIQMCNKRRLTETLSVRGVETGGGGSVLTLESDSPWSEANLG